ncbi:carbonic anhydrase 1-like [Belonocnema kinseyi]|uniref:carbonic anhydrase 1-like n=1 Tax=Belonocnema kinseyi TaxID=2817044 RepID=UPI00143CD130|nr:carbonic anhydrase 1-like [Belonocnema kinseyi]
MCSAEVSSSMLRPMEKSMHSFEMYELHLVAIILLSLILGANAWSYKDAKNWGKKYPKCNGKNQSPIILKTPGLKGFPGYKKTLTFADFEYFPDTSTIKNTGHAVEITGDWSGKPPSCTGGPLNGKYVFEKATFHWAPKKSGGDYPEVYFDAVEEISHKVRSPNSTADLAPVCIKGILEDMTRKASFFFYEGSLDYPPCSESVSWFIVDYCGPITKGLINGLKKIKLAEGDTSNVRPPQALNKRQVKKVHNHDENLDF